MAVDVSRIPNNNKFDPVREAILDLQSQLEAEGQTAYDGEITIDTSGNLTGSGTFTVNQSGNTTITIGIDDSTYLTEELNDLTQNVTWANVPDANITESSVTQHQAALSITESQINDLQDYLVLTETGSQTIDGSVVISGSFTVNGTTTYLNTETVRVEDNIIELNRTPDTPNDTATAATSGIEIYRGNGVTPASFIFDDADDTWDLTNNLAVAGTITTGGDQVITLGDLSVTTNPTPFGSGALLYNEATGDFEYTPPDLSGFVSSSALNAYLPLAGGSLTGLLTTTDVDIFGNATSTGYYTSSANTSGQTYGNFTASGTEDWYMFSLGARGASAGAYGIGLKNDIADRTLSIHVPNHAAYSSTGAIPKIGFYSNGSVELFTVQSDSGDTYTKGDLDVGGTIRIANNVSTGGFTSFDDYQILLYKNGTSVSESYGIGIEGNTMMFNSDTTYKFYVDNAVKVTFSSSGDISATSFTGSGSSLTGVIKSDTDNQVLGRQITLGDRTGSSAYNPNLAGLTLTSVAEVRTSGSDDPPALTWHYEGQKTRHILLDASGNLNVVAPTDEDSGVAVLQVNGSSVATLASFSVTTNATPSGSGALLYNQGTGVFDYTPPDIADFITETEVDNKLLGYLPLTGGTLTGLLTGTSANFFGTVTGTDGIKAGTGGQASWGDAFIDTSLDAGWGTTHQYPYIGSTGGTTGSLIMLHNPHVPFRTDNKAETSYDGRSGLRLARNASGDWWDVGLAGDFFHIYRTGSGELLRLNNSGVLDFGGNSVETTVNDKLAIGVNGTSYAWIQSYGSRPLYLNNLGNNVILANTTTRLGVGTSSPTLSPSGSISGIETRNNSYIQLRVSSSANSAGIEFIPHNTGSTHNYEVQANSAGNWFVYDRTVGGNDGYRFLVNSSGQVGIGTTSPQSILHIGAGSAPAYLSGVALTLGGSQYYSASDGTKTVFMGVDSSAYGIVGTFTNHPLGFRTNNTERTRITAGGTLLHGGTATPGESVWLGTAVVGKDGYDKVIMGSLTSSTNGAIIGGHNSALTAWAPLAIDGTELRFNRQQSRIMTMTADGLAVKRTSLVGSAIHAEGNIIGGTTSTTGTPNRTGISNVLSFEARGTTASADPSICFHKEGIYTMYLQGSNSPRGLRVLSPSNETAANFYSQGDVVAYYSDMRLKTKIGDIQDPIGKIQALNGFYYEPNEIAQSYGYEVERRIGLSAQEVKEVVPEAVHDAPIGDGYMAVDYAKLVPVLVEAIKEQQKQIDELKARLDGSTK